LCSVEKVVVIQIAQLTSQDLDGVGFFMPIVMSLNPKDVESVLNTKVGAEVLMKKRHEPALLAIDAAILAMYD
jgi:hypothetical protein